MATAKKKDTKKKTAKKTPKAVNKVNDVKEVVLGTVKPTGEEIEESVENIIQQAEENKPIVVGDEIAEDINEVKILEETAEEIFEDAAPQEKLNKKITKRIDRTIGYFWNGQAIDF